MRRCRFAVLRRSSSRPTRWPHRGRQLPGARETGFGVEVILPGFVDDAHLTVRCGFRVGKHTVALATIQRRLIARVADTDDEIESSHLLLHVPLDLELEPTSPVCLVPVDLRTAGDTVGQQDVGAPFALAPSPCAMRTSQTANLPDPAAPGDRLRRANRTHDHDVRQPRRPPSGIRLRHYSTQPCRLRSRPARELAPQNANGVRAAAQAPGTVGAGADPEPATGWRRSPPPPSRATCVPGPGSAVAESGATVQNGGTRRRQAPDTGGEA